MIYEISDKDLLDFSKLIYEEGQAGFVDLKESVCYAMMLKFLSDKKRICSVTNLNLNSSALTTDVANFSSEVYTIADRVYTS